jgi:hypothetical protein
MRQERNNGNTVKKFKHGLCTKKAQETLAQHFINEGRFIKTPSNVKLIKISLSAWFSQSFSTMLKGLQTL